MTTVASIIEQNYNFYSAFIIICGLDTICDFGSALSFMLENLGKLVNNILFRLFAQEGIFLCVE